MIAYRNAAWVEQDGFRALLGRFPTLAQVADVARPAPTGPRLASAAARPTAHRAHHLFQPFASQVNVVAAQPGDEPLQVGQVGGLDGGRSTR